MNKILIYATAAAGLAVSVWIGSLYIKLQAERNYSLELKAQGVEKDLRITRAEAALEKQNLATERAEARRKAGALSLQKDYERLNRKYAALKEKSAGAEASCEEKLKSIYEAQEEFLWR